MARVNSTTKETNNNFNVANGTGAEVRAGINDIFTALRTINSASGDPSGAGNVVQFQPHIDSSTNLLKICTAVSSGTGTFTTIGNITQTNLGLASLSTANTFTARATFNVTSSITLPSGTTAQRDASPAVGMIRHNSQTNTFEGYNNGAWGSLSGASGISNVVDDTSPQLGGNLDLQAFELNTSTSNGNIKLNPNGTGLVEVKGDGSSTNGKLQLNCSQNSHGVKLESPDHSASQSYTIKLPDNQIAANKFLKVKSISGSGSTAIGQLEFADGGGGVTSDAQRNTVAGTGAGASFSGTSANDNTLYGQNAGNSITSGDENTALGIFALEDASTASTNVCVGDSALRRTTTGSANVALGKATLSLNTSGTQNVAVGALALEEATDRTGIVAVGYEAFTRLTAGTSNIAIGYQAGDHATNISDSVLIGYSAGTAITTGENNTVVGSHALDACTTGANNCAIGHVALSTLTTGYENVALGRLAGHEVTTGNNNVFLGSNAGFGCTSGTFTVAIGRDALYANQTGVQVTAVGYNALRYSTAGYATAVGHTALDALTTGVAHVAVGDGALSSVQTHEHSVAVGHFALNSCVSNQCTAVGSNNSRYVTTGYRNVSLGYQALLNCTTGIENTILGAGAGTTITTGSNNICVGYDSEPASATTNTSVTLGNSQINSLRCNDTSISGLSDARDKTEVVDLPSGLSFLNSLRPVKFKWQTRDGNGKDGTTRAGFLAQELQEAQKDYDYLDLVLEDNPDRLEAKYGNLIPAMVQAIKELSTKVTALEAG